MAPSPASELATGIRRLDRTIAPVGLSTPLPDSYARRSSGARRNASRGGGGEGRKRSDFRTITDGICEGTEGPPYFWPGYFQAVDKGRFRSCINNLVVDSTEVV
jgi:hypothetical protein